MNKTLTISLLISLTTFGAAYAPYPQSQEDKNARSGERNVISKRLGSKFSEPTPERTEAKIKMLDGWPIAHIHHPMSRAAPRMDYYANLVFEESTSDSQTYFLCSFSIVEKGKRSYYAVQFDRLTQTAKVFDGRRWHDFTIWKTKKLKEIKKRTS